MKTISILLFLNFLFSCKAQMVVPMNTPLRTISPNSYIKDLNGELDPFVGTWFTTHNGDQIKLILTKEIQAPFEILGKNLFRDQLRIRFEVKSSAGQILKSTLNQNFSINPNFDIFSVSTRPSTSEVFLVNSGGHCSIGNGFITLKKINATQLQFTYKPQPAAYVSTNCPPPIDHNIYLPVTDNLVFTKQ